MNRKITTLALLLCIAMATLTLGGCQIIDRILGNDERDEHAQLVDQTLVEMKATDETLKSNISDLTGRVTTLEGELETAKNNIGSVSTALTQEIADRQADIKTLQDKDAELQAQITALETALSNKEQGLTDWAKDTFVTVDEWNEFKTQINTTIASLTSKIETLENSVGKINATLESMKATDKSLKDSIDDLTTRVGTLETELVDVNAKITSLQTDSATKAELENVKNALQEQIDSLNDEITALKAKDEELQEKITALQNSLTSEITDIKTWVDETFVKLSDWNTFKTETNTKIEGLTTRVSKLETTVSDLSKKLASVSDKTYANAKLIEDLQKLVDNLKNCINGVHEYDITYTWEDEFATCTAKAECKYCGRSATEKVSSTLSDGKFTVSFTNDLFSTQVLDPTDLNTVPTSAYEMALNYVFAKKNANVTLTLPEDFSFSNVYNQNIIDNAIKNNATNVNLTLKGAKKVRISDNPYLISINAPDVIEVLGFGGCENLSSVSLAKATTLTANAFYNCTSLTEIELPCVTSIGINAFENTNLRKIKLGSVITDAMMYIFEGVDTTKCILAVAEGQMTFAQQGTTILMNPTDTLVTEEDTEFLGYTFKHIYVGEIGCADHAVGDITYLWSDDFSSCTATARCTSCGETMATETANATLAENFISTATFENSLIPTKSIDLTDRTALSELEFDKAIAAIFASKPTELTFTLPKDYDSFKILYDAIKQAKYDDGTLNLTVKGVETLPASAFQKIDAIKAFTAPDLTKIENRAFFACCGLTTVNIPKVTEIGESAFNSTKNLTEVKLGSEITVIGANAFKNAFALSGLSFGGKSVTIGDDAFSGCSKLEFLIISGTISKIGSNALDYCKKLTRIEFDGTVSELGANVFGNITTENCTLLLADGQKDFTVADDGALTISDKKVSSGDTAFCGKTFKQIATSANTTNMSTDEIKAKLSELVTSGVRAFGITVADNAGADVFSAIKEGLSGAEDGSVSITMSVKTVPTAAFDGWKFLGSLTFGTGVDKIESEALKNTSNLTSITIQGNKIKLGEKAFGGCTSLTSITFEAEIDELPRYIFDGITTENITMSVDKWQEVLEFDTESGVYKKDESGTLLYGSKVFCGYTFKKIIITE